MTETAAQPNDGADIRATLRRHLRERMLARDTSAVQAIRAAVAAIDTAEAQPTDGRSQTDLLLAASTSSDVARREVSDGDARAIVAAEIDDLLAWADEHLGIGKAESAATLERQAELLREILRSDR